MWAGHLKKIAALSSVCGGGIVAGIQLERNWLRPENTDAQINSSRLTSANAEDYNAGSNNNWRLPALPVFATVSAATTFSSDDRSLSPIPAVPAVPVPAKEIPGVPPEPVPGINRISEIMRFGFPGMDNIRAHKNYVVSYDRRNRCAHWVFEHLTKATVQKNESVDRARSDFKEDQSIHPYFRSTNADYKYNGFDRGHLAAAGNHRLNQEICNETFLLSNIAPQVGIGFNRDKWEHLERYVRNLTKVYRNVYVCTGPLYLPKQEQDGKAYVRYQVIGANNVSVPTHFFKVVVCERADTAELEMEAYVLPNEAIQDSTPLESFRVAPDSVERAAGLLFFDRLDRNRLAKINGKKIGSSWI